MNHSYEKKTNLQPTTIPAYKLNLRRSTSVDWNEAKTTGRSLGGTGRRIIGQEAGHEIHLEIEDVQKKKLKLIIKKKGVSGNFIFF